VIIHQRRALLFAAVIVSVGFAIISVAATVVAVIDGSIRETVAFTVLAAAGAVAARSHLKRLREKIPQAILSPDGVTDEYGVSFKWAQITKIPIFTGVLFIKDEAQAGWAVRLDPAEVGPAQVRAAIAFLKQHAPRHLTEQL
jgi:hypothetical protein